MAEYRSRRLPVTTSGVATQMHQCLDIPEVREHIFEHAESSKTLFSLALTCRAFSQNALDILRAIYGDLGPLLQLLLSDLLEKKAGTFQLQQSW